MDVLFRALPVLEPAEVDFNVPWHGKSFAPFRAGRKPLLLNGLC